MLVILNHKSNLTYDEIKKYEKKIRNMKVIILPSLCYLSLFRKGKYILGSQDISEFTETSRTGEVNGTQLKSMNVKYCLIGHSERRIYNKESNNAILTKLKNCFDNDITPIYCIGGDKKDNKKEILKGDIDLILKEFNNKEIIFVYEPIENIGKSNPDLNDVEDTIEFIKNHINKNYKKNIKLIYGGGINENNVDNIKKIKNIDGIILSTDSLNIDNLKNIYKNANSK